MWYNSHVVNMARKRLSPAEKYRFLNSNEGVRMVDKKTRKENLRLLSRCRAFLYGTSPSYPRADASWEHGDVQPATISATDDGPGWVWCPRCERRNPSVYMTSQGVCQDCAQRPGVRCPSPSAIAIRAVCAMGVKLRH